MCFSASASFVAGTSLTAVGVATLKATTRKAELPFAMIPLLFGLQQLTEGMLWLSFRFNAPSLNGTMTYIYSLFSHVLWPVFVPFAIAILEPVAWRRTAISVFRLVGLAVGGYLLYFIVKLPVTSEVVNHSIVYVSPHFYTIPVMIFYFAATCGSCLFSSHRIINIFGILAFVFAIAAYRLYTLSFVSVWCFFAAVLSLIVYLYFFKSGTSRAAEPMGVVAR